MKLIKVFLLGAPGVGKTSIIQQYTRNEFSEVSVPTDRKSVYYQSVLINDHIYDIKITDLPAMKYFPSNSFDEWSDFRFYGLRGATAYILVFDLSNVETFQYLRMMREQIMESREHRGVPLLVVGNKQDLVVVAEPQPGENRRRDIQNLVKKHWKCGYVECSARYNFRVVAVFKELMRTVDALDVGVDSYKEVCMPRQNLQVVVDGNTCVVM